MSLASQLRCAHTCALLLSGGCYAEEEYAPKSKRAKKAAPSKKGAAATKKGAASGKKQPAGAGGGLLREERLGGPA